MSSEILLAVDPALRTTGYAVLARTGKKIACATFGTIKNQPKVQASGCLLAIREQISDLIKAYQPQSMAIEGIIYVQSYQTAITLGAARAAAIIAATEKGLPVYEYAPRRVKQAVVGKGAADKTQVAFMVRALMGLTVTPPADAADAIAIGFTHFQAVDAATIRKTPLTAL